VVERILSTDSNVGLFGHPAYNEDSRKLKTDDYFYQGFAPFLQDLSDEDKPKISLPDNNDQEWMTYEESRIVALYDETASSELGQAKYRIVHAQEAPVIITATANAEFKPDQISEISVSLNLHDTNFPSSQGANKTPVNTILEGHIDNPMGYGAKEGDWVTLQRVWTGSAGLYDANYRYIVIGTSSPPGAIKP
jgi:hypothetical protein